VAVNILTISAMLASGTVRQSIIDRAKGKHLDWAVVVRIIKAESVPRI